MQSRLAIKVRRSSRPDTVLRPRPAHLRVTVVVAAATVARPPSPPTTMTNNTNQPTALDTHVHLSSTSPGTTSRARFLMRRADNERRRYLEPVRNFLGATLLLGDLLIRLRRLISLVGNQDVLGVK